MLKKTLFIICFVLNLAACSNEDIEKAENEELLVTSNDNGVKDLDNTQDDELLGAILEEEVDITKTYSVQQPIESGIFGEERQIEVNEIVETEKNIHTVYKGHKIVQDSQGRIGIVLFSTRTNTSDEPVIFEEFETPTNTALYVSYNDLTLIDQAFSDEEVLADPYLSKVVVDYENPSMTLCNQIIEVGPGETNDCYNLISFVGKGNYKLIWPMFGEDLFVTGSRVIEFEIE